MGVAEQVLQLADLGVVAVKQVQKAGLRAGRSFHAAGLERAHAMLDLGTILGQT